MSIGFVPPVGPGADYWYQGEPFNGDPRVPPGLARPIGWRVRAPDGSDAFDKWGPLDTDWTPVGIPSTGTATLATTYAAGAATPSTSDVMGMQLGSKLRFQASANGQLMPYIAGYETTGAAPIVATGLPAAGWSLYDGTPGGFGRLFNSYQMFSPSWDGTFNGIHSIGPFWTVEQISFVAAAQTSWNGGFPVGLRRYVANANQPEGYPVPVGTLACRAMFHQLGLYNEDVATQVDVQWIDGWGQQRGQLWPNAHGVTWAQTTHFRNNVIPGGLAIGDGTGWGIFESAIDHGGGDNPRGALWCRALDLAGNWQWSIAVNDGAGGFLSVADFAAAGIAFNVPVSVPATATISQIYQSGVVDLRTPGLHNLNTPLVAGKKLVFIFARLRILTRDAALTTGLSWNYAQNGAVCAGLVASPIASLNADAAPTNIGASPSFVHEIDMTTFPLQVQITTGVAGSGLTTCTGQWEVEAIYQ